MSLSVALIDKSEIIKKMFSHSLHYYSAKIHRFDSLNEFQAQKNQIKADVLFIDWELQEGGKPTAVIAEKIIKDIPIVAIYRNEDDAPIKEFRTTIKKPINPSTLRKIVQNIAKKTTRSRIHNFLDFSSMEEKTFTETEDAAKENASVTKQPANTAGENINTVKNPAGLTIQSSRPSTENVRASTENTSASRENASASRENANTTKNHADLTIKNKNAAAEIKDLVIETEGPSIEFEETTNTKSLNLHLHQENASKAKKTAEFNNRRYSNSTQTPNQASTPAPTSTSNQEQTQTQAPAKEPKILIDRSSVNVDELSFGDFAPISIDNSGRNEDLTHTTMSHQNKATTAGSNINISKKEIQETVREVFLKEYKNSLEFESLIEKNLKTYATKLSQQILEKDYKQILQQSFSNFKDSNEFQTTLAKIFMAEEFQVLFRAELKTFIDKEMPVLAKEMIKAEIQKILKEIS